MKINGNLGNDNRFSIIPFGYKHVLLFFGARWDPPLLTEIFLRQPFGIATQLDVPSKALEIFPRNSERQIGALTLPRKTTQK